MFVCIYTEIYAYIYIYIYILYIYIYIYMYMYILIIYIYLMSEEPLNLNIYTPQTAVQSDGARARPEAAPPRYQARQYPPLQVS